MNLLTCILTENDCCKDKKTITPKGVIVHSTAANNPNLKRYIQPISSTPDRDRLLSLLGTNANGNHWNRKMDEKKCVHAFIGKLADGSVAAVQTLPWTQKGWHSASGSKGSANKTHIAFEICEDGLTDPDYFGQIYREAVELTAHLCRLYGLDPLADGVVICHKEGYRRGIASNHADVEHWFPKHGKSMDDFRADVAAEIGLSKPEEKKEGYCTVDIKVLKKGAKGENVRALQYLLIGNGFSCSSCGADGSFGGDTDKAVRAYQEARGLAVDGSCGGNTWRRLLGVG